jgi:hypothetical protein
MSSKIIAILSVIFLATIVAAAWYIDDLSRNANTGLPDPMTDKPASSVLKPDEPVQSASLIKEEAAAIAERDCIKGGETLEPGIYNEATRTWWFDANLNATRPGCNPACVVSEDTGIAEINWRCTGAIPPTSGNINNFEECAAAGNPILKSNPAQCVANGKTFMEETGQIMTCLKDSRNAEACAQVFDPVCATVDIQCVKAPCDPVRQTFSSACEACMNPLVNTYASGECERSGAEAN